MPTRTDVPADPEHPPTEKEMADAARELAEIAHSIAVMPHPPGDDILDAVQLRLVKATTAVISWSAPEPPPPPPPDPAPPITSPEPPPELPTPGRIIPADSDTFRDVLAERREPNDRILLAPGHYRGRLELPFDVPLQIVSAVPLEACFSGDIVVSGRRIILSGIACRNDKARNGTSVTLSGLNCHLHRSLVSRSTGHCVDLVGKDCSVEWCDLSVWGKQEVPQGDSSTYFGFVHDPNAKGVRNRIYRCFLHDGPFKEPGNYHKFGITGIGVGVNPKDFQTESWLEILENLFEDCGDCDISIKTSHNLIAGNTILGKKAKSYGNQRSGNYNHWRGNWFDELAYGFEIVVHGGHHLIINNRARIALRWGNFEWNAMPSGETRHHRAYAVRLVGNEGRCTYGQRYSGESGKLKMPPKDCVFIGQRFDPSGGIGARVEPLAESEISSTARKLTLAEVGPAGKVAAS